MSDKLYVEVVTRLIIRKDSDIDLDEIMENVDYNFNDQTGKADIEDTEIRKWEVQDVK